MLNKIQGRPSWYKIWAILVGITALYTLIIFVGALLKNSLVNITAIDYFLLCFVHLSLLLEMYLFPEKENKKPNQN